MLKDATCTLVAKKSERAQSMKIDSREKSGEKSENSTFGKISFIFKFAKKPMSWSFLTLLHLQVYSKVKVTVKAKKIDDFEIRFLFCV